MTTALLPLMSESTLRDMAIECVSKADQTAYDFAREAYIDARDTLDPGDALSVNDEEFEGVLTTPGGDIFYSVTLNGSVFETRSTGEMTCNLDVALAVIEADNSDLVTPEMLGALNAAFNRYSTPLTIH